MSRLLLAAALLLSACSKRAPKGAVIYEDRGGRFALAVGEHWRVSEDASGAAFFSAAATLSARVEPGTPDLYRAGQVVAGLVSPLVETTVAGRKAYTLLSERMGPAIHGAPGVRLTTHAALIPLKTGLLVVAATAEPGGEAAADEALTRALESLQIK